MGICVAAGGLLLAVHSRYGWFGGAIDRPRLSLVVLPFENLSGDPRDDYLYKSALDLSDIVRCNRLRAASLMVWRCVADLKPGAFGAPLRGCGA